MIAAFDRPAKHQASRATILVTATIAAAVLATLVYIAAVAPRGVPGLPYYYLNAQFRDAANIRILSTVQIAGRRVGQVSDVTYSNGLANLKLQMLPGTQTLSSGVAARIRVKNPIGAKYVELTPRATGTTLHNGATIPVSQTSTSVDTQTLLSTFDAPTRQNLRSTLVGLGQGFLGRGQGINQALPIAAPELSNYNAVAQAILSIPGAAARFAPSADSLAAAYDPVRQPLAAGFQPEHQVLQDFADERAAIRQTLDVAPGSLSALRGGLARAQPLLDQLAGFARATAAFTAPAATALPAAARLLRAGIPSLRRTAPLLRSLGAAVSPTDALLVAVDPVIAPSIRVLHNQVQPLSHFASHGCDVIGETTTWRSAMSWGVPGGYDPTSHLTDLEPGLGPDINSFRVLVLPPASTETLNADAPGSFPHGTDAYPAPCAAQAETMP